MGYFAQGVPVVTMDSEGAKQFRHPGNITEIQRHDGPIKIGTEGHVSDANAPSNIIDVAYNFRKRRIGFPPPVLTQKADVKVDPHNAVRFFDSIQLFIG